MFYITDFDRINRDANGRSTFENVLEDAARDFVESSSYFNQFVDVRDLIKHEKRHRAEPVEDDSLYDKLDLSVVL